MNYCGAPIYNPDVRFLETFETVDTKPINMGHVEKDYKYNPENDVDISLGIRPNQGNKNTKKSHWLMFWL